MHRGLREPAAVVVGGGRGAADRTSAGAGVNAAVTAWVLVGPLALALYERLTGAVATRGRCATSRCAPGRCRRWPRRGGLAPVLVQTLYGIDFLRFTEQPGAIWSSTALTESLRG